MTLLGFRRMHIVVEPDESAAKHYVVEGNKDLGATSTAEITGINKEPKQVPGSDGIYTVLQQGTGQVTVNLGLLDLPFDVENEILGFEKTAEGFIKIGDTTTPPTCSIVLQSSDMRGKPMYYGFFKGKFSKESIAMNTKQPDSDEIEAESYIFTPYTNDIGKLKGQMALLHKGEEKSTEYLKLFGIEDSTAGGASGGTSSRSVIVPDSDKKSK